MIAGLHELLEFAREGLTVTDKLDPDDEHVAFRTLVQIDGDVCVSICPRALARPDFDELHQAHLEHVERLLSERVRRLRRWSIAVGNAGSGAAVLVVVGYWGSGALEMMLVDQLEAWLQVAGVTVVGGMLWASSLRLLRWLLDRRSLDEGGERLASTIARLVERG